MSHKSGFVVGLVIGVLAFLLQNGIISLSLFPFQPTALIFEFAGAMVLLSFVVGIVSTLRHKAVLGVTVDAAIFGFTTGFGLLPIITVLTAGHLPNPVPQAISIIRIEFPRFHLDPGPCDLPMSFEPSVFEGEYSKPLRR